MIHGVVNTNLNLWQMSQPHSSLIVTNVRRKSMNEPITHSAKIHETTLTIQNSIKEAIAVFVRMAMEEMVKSALFRMLAKSLLQEEDANTSA